MILLTKRKNASIYTILSVNSIRNFIIPAKLTVVPVAIERQKLSTGLIAALSLLAIAIGRILYSAPELIILLILLLFLGLYKLTVSLGEIIISWSESSFLYLI